MRSVHAAARKAGYTHEDLSACAEREYGHKSLTECTIEELRWIYDTIKAGTFEPSHEREPGDEPLGFDPNEGVPLDL